MWHETERAAAEVISGFVETLEDLVEDEPNVIMLMDNCSLQNKNLYLFTTKLSFNGVNSLVGLQRVTLNT